MGEGPAGTGSVSPGREPSGDVAEIGPGAGNGCPAIGSPPTRRSAVVTANTAGGYRMRCPRRQCLGVDAGGDQRLIEQAVFVGN